MSDAVVWNLVYKDRQYVKMTFSAQQRQFGGSVNEGGLYVLHVGLVKEVVGTSRAASLARTVQITITVTPVDGMKLVLHEKLTSGDRNKAAIRFETKSAFKFSLVLKSTSKLVAAYVSAQIAKKFVPLAITDASINKEHQSTAQKITTEIVGTSLLDVPGDLQKKLANWIEDQAKNQQAIKQLTERIQKVDDDLEEIKKRIKYAKKYNEKHKMPEFKNSELELETLREALLQNKYSLEREELELLSNQLKFKIQVKEEEIQQIKIMIDELHSSGLTDATMGEFIRLNQELEEKGMLLQSLELNWQSVAEKLPQGSVQMAKFEEKLFDVEKLPSALREKLQSACDEWPSKTDFPDILTYPQHKAVDELTRDSEYKTKAWNKGLIKPFLLLVSMHPEKRLRWAKWLKVPILTLKNYGDSHAEAFKILTMDRKGLQARANHAFADTLNPLGRDCNWYQVLQRVCRKSLLNSKKVADLKDDIKLSRKTFDKSIEWCQTSNDEDICGLEELFLEGIMQVMMYLLQQSDQYTLDLVMKKMETLEQSDAARYIANLQLCGFRNMEVIKFYITCVLIGGENFFVNILINWAKTKHEGVAGNRVRLVIPVVGMVFSVALAVPIFMVFGLISPLILLPCSLLAVNSAMYIWRETPGKLLNPLLVILQQQVYLALQGIRVQQFYPNYTAKLESRVVVRNRIVEQKNNLKKNLVTLLPDKNLLNNLSTATVQQWEKDMNADSNVEDTNGTALPIDSAPPDYSDDENEEYVNDPPPPIDTLSLEDGLLLPEEAPPSYDDYSEDETVDSTL